LYGQLKCLLVGQSDGLCRKLTVACPKPKPIMGDLSRETKDAWEIERERVLPSKGN